MKHIAMQEELNGKMVDWMDETELTNTQQSHDE
jgi:hypothetical protein